MYINLIQHVKKIVFTTTVFYLASVISAKSSPFQNIQTTSDSTYKTWFYTPSGVFGRKSLSRVKGQEYVKISKISPEEIQVNKYNPAGILINITTLWFFNTKLSLITETDRWGNSYDSIWIKPTSPNKYLVKEKLRGVNPNAPCFALRYEYQNNMLTDIYCMKDSIRTGENQEGVSHYVFERYSDPKRFGLLKSTSFFGVIDEWVNSRKEDCHKILYSYDEEGNLTSKAKYGLNDKPVADRNGYFKTVMKYDKYGNETQMDQYDAESVLANDLSGCARFIYDYKNGFLTKETCYDLEYKIINPSKEVDFTAITEHKYDDNGNETEKAFFDQDYKNINNRKGIHKTIYEYNSEGMITGISFFNDKENPKADESGIHTYHFERNHKNQIASISFYNYLNQPVKDAVNGAFELKFKYDNWGRVISNSYWVNDSTKLLNKFGNHETVTTYNPDGLITIVDFLDKEGKPSSKKSMPTRQVFEYNDLYQISERKYYFRDQPLMITESNYFISNFHSIKYSYDYFNRVTSVEYFDDQQKPVEAKIRLANAEEIKCKKVEFLYKKNQLSSEIFSSDTGAIVVDDCAKKTCLLPSGSEISIPNSRILFQAQSVIKKQFNIGRKVEDSLLFADQFAFLSPDTLLLFLNANASAISAKNCATYYRIAPISPYFQLNGMVTDYYIIGGNIADSLNYELGQLNGPAVYYYQNGIIKEKGSYRNNKRTGVWSYYYSNGLIHKTINFTDSATYLVDCFMENGKALVQNGNGIFEGYILTGNLSVSTQYYITGQIKNGIQEGEWKLYDFRGNPPLTVEKFSKGTFKKGITQAAYGKTEYNKNHLTTFESFHPEDFLDYYGQDILCLSKFKTVAFHEKNVNVLSIDFSDKLHAGMLEILKDNSYKNFGGWVFIDLKYDKTGKLSNKYIRLANENPAFKNDLLKMLDRFDFQEPLVMDGEETAYEKFYILLVDANEVVIPETLFKKQRSQPIPPL